MIFSSVAHVDNLYNIATIGKPSKIASQIFTFIYLLLLRLRRIRGIWR